MLPFATTMISVAIIRTLLQQQRVVIATIHFGCDIVKNSNQSKKHCNSLTLHATHIFSLQIPHHVAMIKTLIATL